MPDMTDNGIGNRVALTLVPISLGGRQGGYIGGLDTQLGVRGGGVDAGYEEEGDGVRDGGLQLGCPQDTVAEREARCT